MNCCTHSLKNRAGFLPTNSSYKSALEDVATTNYSGSVLNSSTASEPTLLVENRLQRRRYLTHNKSKYAACVSRKVSYVRLSLCGVVGILHQPRAISLSSAEWLALIVLETLCRLVHCVATSCLASAKSQNLPPSHKRQRLCLPLPSMGMMLL